MAKFGFLGDIKATLNEWAVLLRSLSFRENFRSYEWEGEIEAGKEQPIAHGLKVIPTRFIVLDAQGTNAIVRGDTRPTVDRFYVKNVATTSTFKGKILVMP